MHHLRGCVRHGRALKHLRETRMEALEQTSMQGDKKAGRVGARNLLLKRRRGAGLQLSLAFDWLLIVCGDVHSRGSVGVEERMS